ncbi:MAG: hypothetical protein ABI091_14825 [Ferruginibacter sp.]
MEITWEVEDGYSGKSRPQHTEIDDQDIAECKTKEEFEKLINEAVQEDFEQTISFFFKMPEFKPIKQ